MSGLICEYNLPPVKKKKKVKSPEPLEKTNLMLSERSPASSLDTKDAIDEPKPIAYSYNLEGNNEYDGYIFRDLIRDQVINLSTVNNIKQSIHKANGDLFLQIDSWVGNEAIEQFSKIQRIVGENGPKLVALYFRIVHSSFPIIFQPKFIDDYRENSTNISPSLLSCLYLFALNWWSFDSDLSTEVQPSQLELETLAEQNLYKEMKRPTLSTIQAGLLLVQHQSFRSSTDNNFECWPMQCAVLAAAQTLGLNKDPTHLDIPEWEKSIRKRLAWALYVQEKWLSFTIDKPSHINEDDWLVSDVTYSDFQDFLQSSSPTIDAMIDYHTGKLLFLQKIELTKILDSILLKLNSNGAKQHLRALSNQDLLGALKDTLEYIKPLQVALTNWESQLPKELIIESTVSRGFISGAPNMYISNFLAQISILRPVLRIISGVRDQKLQVSKEFMGIRDIVFNKCMAIFDNILKFLNELRAEHLQTFWYTSAKNGFSNIVIFGYFLTLISKDKSEFDSCKDKIEEFVWKLKINTKNAEFLHHSVLWWSQMKKILAQKLDRITFFNEENINDAMSLILISSQSPIQEKPLNDSFLLPELFNLESIDNFIFNYQNN